MAYVARFRNYATGSVQIGEDYANLALRDIVTITSAPSSETGWGFRAQLTVNAPEYPVVAIRSTAYVQMHQVQRSGNNWTFTYFVSANAAAITCYVFGPPDVSALPAGYTLRLRNPSTGQVTFDHRLKYARIDRDRSMAGSGFAGGSVSLPTGTTYAAIQCRYAGAYEHEVFEGGGHAGGVNSQIHMRRGLGIRFSGSTAQRGLLSVYNHMSPSTDSPGLKTFVEWLNWQWLLLDVTGY